ncbi:MAG TPA: hypothetical protein VFK80_02465, partial [Limnochordia bacterium]|nr:hypothetical protein [Limnochordia bacterium]
DGSVHVVTGLPGSVGSFAWLADGSGWVVSVTLPADNPSQRSDALYVAPLGAGGARQLFVAAGDGLRLAGPVSVTGRFAYWRDPLHSASLAADGLPLLVAEVGAGDPGSGSPGLPMSKSLATTLPYPAWVRWSPDGTRLLVVAGSGRDARRGKRLALCDAVAATCTDLPQPSGRVSLDPAFSPDGTRIAFVRASAVGDGMIGGTSGEGGGGAGGAGSGGIGGNVGAAAGGWAASRTLVIARSDGSGAHPLPNAGTGVEAPLWADRVHVLYWRDGALWLLAVDAADASPVRVRTGDTGVPGTYLGYADPWVGAAWQVRP